MAQFDVHPNPGRNRDAIPFVVTVQSSAYDVHSRRVVVPLVRKTTDVPAYAKRLNPTFIIGDISVVLHPLDIASVPADRLGERVGSLAEFGDDIIGAIDMLLSRAYD